MYCGVSKYISVNANAVTIALHTSKMRARSDAFGGDVSVQAQAAQAKADTDERDIPTKKDIKQLVRDEEE